MELTGRGSFGRIGCMKNPSTHRCDTRVARFGGPYADEDVVIWYQNFFEDEKLHPVFLLQFIFDFYLTPEQECDTLVKNNVAMGFALASGWAGTHLQRMHFTRELLCNKTSDSVSTPTECGCASCFLPTTSRYLFLSIPYPRSTSSVWVCQCNNATRCVSVH